MTESRRDLPPQQYRGTTAFIHRASEYPGAPLETLPFARPTWTATWQIAVSKDYAAIHSSCLKSLLGTCTGCGTPPDFSCLLRAMVG